MTHILVLFLGVLLLTVTGCGKSPQIQIDQKSSDGIEPVQEQVIGQVNENVKIVSGEDATVLDDDEVNKKDEAGAVAVQVQY